ncbi:MAG: hypothetical protein IKJ93_02530 [Clostridia bacterium]|nr:hypothetical protein [Clostridia bacterium]
MHKFNRILCVMLSLAICIGCVTTIPAKATTDTIYPIEGEIRVLPPDVALIYSLAGTTGHEAKKKDKNKSEKIAELVDETSVLVVGEAEDGDGDKWYKIKFGDSFKKTGYVYNTFVMLKPEYKLDKAFEKTLKDFPESYHDDLRTLHAKFPNWKFVANKIDLSLKDAVDLQFNPAATNCAANKKLVELTYGGKEWRDKRAYNSSTKRYVEKYSGWTYASRSAIAYFVDPRNYLDDSYIFAFLQQPYDKKLQDKEGLRTVVAGTFLEKGYDKDKDSKIDKDAYIDDIMLAAKESGVSPYVLAAAIIVEVGVNGSTVTSGKKYTHTYIDPKTNKKVTKQYKGVYNFYNWNATGDDVIGNALKYAKEQGWTSREKAIVGGAKLYAEGYIEVGQDTYYYKNYNYVVEPYSEHQFAESIYGSIADSQKISKAFLGDENKTAIFEIPVFEKMGDTPNPAPTLKDNSSGNNSNDNSADSSEDNSTDSSDNSSGDNSSSESTTSKPEPEPKPEPVIKKGDINGDDKISIVDLAALKRHMLEVKKLKGDALKAADVNDDGNVSIIDLAAIKRHLLGVKTID